MPPSDPDRPAALGTTPTAGRMLNTGRMPVVDLNADLAEGDHLSDRDRGVLASVTSASLACGFHAGGPRVMRSTAEVCVARGVAIGAHVSYRDRAGFGRRDLDIDPGTLARDIVEQWRILDEQVRAVGGTVSFVKPHGALYHRMGHDPAVAGAVVRAVDQVGGGALVAQAGTEVAGVAARIGLRVVAEGFPDRAYLADGHLAPRSRPGALVEDPVVVGGRAVALALRGGTEAVDGSWTPVEAETLCIHGDAEGADETARAVRAALEAAGVTVRSFVDGDGSPDDGAHDR